MIFQKTRCLALAVAVLMLLGMHQLVRAQQSQQPVSLTVEQAKEIVAGKNVELLQSVTELSVEVAQVLSQYSNSTFLQATISFACSTVSDADLWSCA